ncbi:hypothetical protein ACHAWF_001813, partial [Thalassiosira exigua]
MPTDPIWPAAAASRIRVKDPENDALRCRLFLDPSAGVVELVPCDDKAAAPQREVYDDSDVNVEEEPYYRSYVATANDDYRIVRYSFDPDDVIGVDLSLDFNARNPNTFPGMESYASATINVYSYPKAGGRNKRTADHKHYELDPSCCEDFADARAIVRSIRQFAKLRDAAKPLKCLVILNPFSGGNTETSKTGSRRVYCDVVKPMLDEAGVDHEALVTRRAGHARERMDAREAGAEDEAGGASEANDDDPKDPVDTDLEVKDIAEYDAILVIGGDGILSEIFQGIRDRSDSDAILPALKFGVVGCGTFNGLVKSLLHWSGAEYDRLESVFHVCKGRTSALDLAEYRVLSEEGSASYTSFLTFAWGLVADCDYESECIRWLGPLRSDVWVVYRGLLNQRRYIGRFSYLPSREAASKDGGKEAVVMPELGRPLPDGWESTEDDFSVFWVCNTSHSAHNLFTAPSARMDDGLFHVILVRSSSCSRIRMAQLFLKVETGGHVDFPEVEVVDCVAYQFEPLSDISYNVLDGELIENGPIQARIMPGGAQMFVGESKLKSHYLTPVKTNERRLPPLQHGGSCCMRARSLLCSARGSAPSRG